MDTAEEPQKKIFKARKTMKTSDRQQLEAIHKAKEDLLKPTELKLVNGNHENGDSDMSSIHNETDSLEDKSDLNGILDINCDKHVVKVNLSDLKEGLRNVDQASDFKLPAELNLPESIACEDTSRNVTSEADIQPPLDIGDPKLDENISALEANDQIVSEGLSLLESLPGDAESSEEHTQANIPIEDDGNVIVAESLNESENVNPVENSVEKECADTGTLENLNSDNLETVSEMHSLESLDAEGVDCSNVENDNSDKEHPDEQEINELLDGEIQSTEEPEENNGKEEIVEPINLQENVTDMETAESECSEKINESKTEDIPSPQQDVGEEAISSSMEVDPTLKSIEQSPSLAEVAPDDKTAPELEQGSGLESVDAMETDEIIPILEKLAPVQDDLQCFSKSVLHAENSVATQEKVEDAADSPSKNDVSGSLPSEAFLVLSDEEEPSEITPAQEITAIDEDSSKVVTTEAAVAEEQEKQKETSCDTEPEKSEAPHRKRSKSEDLDSQSSKRRRFEGEEYEAELKVKITAGDVLNQKLQKVIQRMFEEKLSALQCADFDKAIADLKTRVEKIECKKHENVLHTIQAKITRLTRRFGAAKEDLKRRPEQSTVNQSATPGTSAVTDLTSNASPNSAAYRNTGTVRQMLESKRSVVETTTTTTNLQMPTTALPTTPTAPSSSNLTIRTSTASQISVSQPSANTTLQTRAPPDWKLIQQKINAQNTQSAQSKPNPPVTSSSVIPSVLSPPSTATVVGNSQVSTSSTQPMSVSLQSLPVILHVPVAMPSQSQILQGTTGTLVTNQQSGNVEFIPVQNQSTAGNLTKTPVTLPVTKAVNSPSMPSPSIQRNSPATSVPSTLSVHAISSSHQTLSSRQSLPPVGSSGIYSQTTNRNAAQLKSPVSGFNNSSESSIGRTDLQAGRAPTVEPVTNKRMPESSAQSGKSTAGVIDLTLDDEDHELSSQDLRRTSNTTVSTNVQPSLSVSRQSQPPQMNNLQSTPVGLSSQATIHVLPTAQTTVNITQRPGTQPATRPSAPRAPHMVYTTTALPTIPAQAPVRNTVMQNQNLRQMTPQTAGVPVRMPQNAAYVVNNGMPMGSGPQLTVHHRPPQEPARPIHPAPLPDAPQPQRLPPEAASTSPPQKPHLKLARVQSQNGIVLSWSVLEVDRSCAVVDSYHLYAYHEDPSATSPSQWKKIGEVKALPLPMACTLTQFVSGSKYYFAVRAKDIYARFGPFCDPQSTDVISTQSS
ncbi:activating transcription factor 7-interacting protein 1 [Mantella aurantiaca]